MQIVPAWRIHTTAPLQLKTRKPDWVAVDADELRVTESGTLVFLREGLPCLVVPPQSYGYLERIGATAARAVRDEEWDSP
jgi:hypothetical protein